MFHPNVYVDGRICIDILKSQWSPIFDIGHILISIQSLLSDPNPDSPANPEASKLFQEDRREYNRRVRLVLKDHGKKLVVKMVMEGTINEPLRSLRVKYEMI